MPGRTQNAGEYESIITVRFHPQVGVAAINNISGNLNLTELRRTKSNFIDYQLADGADLMAIANSLRSLPQVEAVQLNTFGEFLGMPNDPLANETQWHIERLRLEEVWDEETGSEKVIVAVIDSGLDYNHPDIGFGDDGYSNLYFNKVEDDWSDPNDPSSGNGIDDDGNGKIDDWRGWNSIDDSNDIRDTGSHGTRMAGFIAAKTNNNGGVAGVAGGFGSPGVRIMPIKLIKNEEENLRASSLAHAIDYATDQGARVINMSIGFFDPDATGISTEYPAVSAAIDRAVEHGVILLAAAGNPNANSQGEEYIIFPARHPRVICISGINQSDQRFGDFGFTPPFGDGEETALVDFVAPSVGLQSTTLSTISNGYEIGNGTSDATAITTGIVGLLVSTDFCADRDNIFEILKNTAEKIGSTPVNDIYTDYPDDPGRHQKFGYGLVNPLDAILSIRNGLASNPVAGSTTTFNTSENISQDYIIPTGATVVVASSGVLNLAPDTRIIIERGAKLIVDGGKITSCLAGKWRSIFVMGNGERPQPTDPAAELDPEDAGVLWVKNGATIENARNAIATRHPDLYWLPEYWGGLVVVEDATLENNRRAAEFMSYTPSNQSRFINTTFRYDDEDDNLAAITIWDTDDISLEGCTFEGYDTGVVAYDAGCNMSANVLKDCDFGLEVFATSPVSSGAPVNVSDNTFRNIRLDAINSHSANVPQILDIRDNQFVNNEWSIFLSGQSDFQIIDNRIEVGNGPSLGVHVWNTGLGLAEINCNTIDGVEFAIIAGGDCSGLSVLDNGFTSTYSDIVLTEGDDNIGKLAPSQGQENIPANNCFSSGHNEHLANYGATEPYTYYVPNNVAGTDCRIPVSDGGNTITPTPDFFLIECDRPFPMDDPGDDKYTYLDLLDRYLLAKEGDYREGYESVKELHRELRSGLHHWLRNGLKDGVSSDLEDVLLATDTKEGLQQLYGIHLARREMNLAKDYLVEIAASGLAADFVAVQDINIARLESTDQAFELNPVQTETLEQIAIKSTPAGNHAKALLSLLHHAHFPAQLNPLYYQNVQLSIGSQQNNGNSSIQAYPNPASETLNMRYLPYSTATGLVELYNSLGHNIRSEAFASTTELSFNVQNLLNGLYTLVISTPDGSVTTLQVSIQH